jgi:hypothetical protein
MMKVDKWKIIDAQIQELRAIKAEMDLHPKLTFAEVMDRRPPYIGWIDENGNVRESPRMARAYES